VASDCCKLEELYQVLVVNTSGGLGACFECMTLGVSAVSVLCTRYSTWGRGLRRSCVERLVYLSWIECVTVGTWHCLLRQALLLGLKSSAREEVLIMSLRASAALSSLTQSSSCLLSTRLTLYLISHIPCLSLPRELFSCLCRGVFN